MQKPPQAINSLVFTLRRGSLHVAQKAIFFYNWNHILLLLLFHSQSSKLFATQTHRNTIIIEKKMSERKEEMEEVEVIHSWSAPRSLSTCLMYSFAQVGLFCFSLTFVLFFQIHSLLGCLERKSMRCFFLLLSWKLGFL